MTRFLFNLWLPLVPLTLLGACAVREIDAILAKYDTFGDTDSSTGDPSTSTTGTSTGGSSSDGTTAVLDTTSTGSGEAGVDASSDTGSSSTGSSSTGAAPVCGDGGVDPGEECDDMNEDPDDGCKLCTRDRLVFATSEEYQGFKLGGLFTADQRCRHLAAVAELPNFASFRAWLSDSSEAAADRIKHSKGRYVLVNGLVVAADWDALVSGSLKTPINVDENSQTSIGQVVWTGTLPDGQPALGSTFCNDWAGDDDTQFGGSGIRTMTDELWSFFEHNVCGSIAVLYCFEN